jgi:hypothetical protein
MTRETVAFGRPTLRVSSACVSAGSSGEKQARIATASSRELILTVLNDGGQVFQYWNVMSNMKPTLDTTTRKFYKYANLERSLTIRHIPTE